MDRAVAWLTGLDVLVNNVLALMLLAGSSTANRQSPWLDR
jgi:hypothetical protein